MGTRDEHEVRGQAPAAFTVNFVVETLAARGVLAREQVEEVLAQKDRVASIVRREKERTLAGWQTRDYEVSPVEIVAAFGFTAVDGGQVDEDRIMATVADRTGLPYEKIDPLKLDARLITATLSRPFARRHIVLPLRQTTDTLTVALENPFDLDVRETLRQLTGRQVDVVLAARADILKLITEIYGFRSSIRAAERDMGPTPDLGNLEQFVRLKSVDDIDASDKHIVHAVDYLLRYAFEQRASDIHLEPKRDVALVRLRIDGILHEVHRIPKAVHPAVVSRLKMMGRMDIAEKRRPQDGRVKTAWGDKEVELRLSSLPVAFGEKLVIRVFEPHHLLQDLAELGFEPSDLALYDRWLRAPHGIILVCGPTGSGKTTTLYSSLKELATPDVNITTIEDPIEMVVALFNQTAVQPKAGITFASALRTLLRQDPDIIMVGEIRDAETAEHAIQAALTGHLVFSTLHTVDSPSAVTRLLDLGIPPYLIASTLNGVLSQRLVRRVCDGCAQAAHLSPAELRALSIPATDDGLGLHRVQRGAGCPRCRGTGYRGRSGVFELMAGSEELQRLIMDRAPTPRLRRFATEQGMRTLREAAVSKLLQGITTFDEVLRVTADVR